MKILLHVCCAPCSIQSIEMLKELGHDVSAIWYNLNIHPVLEYRSRKNAMIEYAQKIDLKLDVVDEYGLREFINKTYPDFDTRCEKCYDMRFDYAAEHAVQNGYDGFSSSLFISPYQDIELMKKSANKAAEAHGVSFVYVDFRERFRASQNAARESGIYMQKYCGCIFSEDERYSKKMGSKC